MQDKILKGARAIAEHTGLEEREIRHLMKAHGLPHTQRGRAIYALASKVERYFGGEE